MKNTIVLLTSLALVVLSQSTRAQTLAVNFGADYTSIAINNTAASTFVNGDFNFNGTADDRAAIIPFGTIADFTSRPSFITPAGKSGAVIKYGISVANIGTFTNPEIGLNRINSGDSIQAGQNATGATSAMRLASAWYWEKDSFLNGQNNPSYNLSFASLTNSLSAILSGAGTGMVSRFIVQSGGQWYLSVDNTIVKGATLAINGSTSSWYAFDPVANALFWDRGNPGSTFAGSTLTDISAIGVYQQTRGLIENSDIYDGITTPTRLEFNNLQATLVPEPSTYALLAVASVVMLLALHRRRQRQRQ